MKNDVFACVAPEDATALRGIVGAMAQPNEVLAVHLVSDHEIEVTIGQFAGPRTGHGRSLLMRKNGSTWTVIRENNWLA